ncbi:MAG TPA: hypothetical protein VJJ70_06100 [Anaerolineales bacterium]|nr:hypothetical protein [Anaerolineales bacterium]
MQITRIDGRPLDAEWHGLGAETSPVSREFESALAAFRCGDPNPLRQYYGLPTRVPCADCGRETVPVVFDHDLLCRLCDYWRREELNERWAASLIDGRTRRNEESHA